MKPYHQTTQLLIQFILSELCKAGLVIRKMIENQELPKKTRAEKLAKLTGSSWDLMRILSWEEDGHLAKLHNYTALFSKHDLGMIKEQHSLQKEANKAWLFGIEAFEAAHAEIDQTIDSILTKISACLAKMSKLILNIAAQFSTNENVLFFLIRHQPQLDALCGSNTITKWIKKLFPNGLKDVQEFLVTKYRERGFEQIIPHINTAILVAENQVTKEI